MRQILKTDGKQSEASPTRKIAFTGDSCFMNHSACGTISPRGDLMYTKQPKKLLILNILDILRRYSDENHRLTQQDIIQYLKRDYEMAADCKAIKRNLADLLEAGCQLEYSETIRRGRNGEEESILTDWYLVRDFSDAELRLMIDSLLFSRNIPTHQCREMIGKLEGLSSQYFHAKVRHVCNLPDDRPANPALFYTVEVLDEAIEQGLQVTFHYGDYGTDGRVHLRTADGRPKEYLVNPYQMAAANGRYYLIGNVDKYSTVAHFRVDRIRDIVLKDTPAKPARQVEGLQYGFNLPRHMAEHIYMFSGESARVRLKTSPGMAGELIDWFGTGVTFSDETEDSVIATVTVNLQAMRYWALQYAPYVTVLEPEGLREEIWQDLERARENYSK